MGKDLINGIIAIITAVLGIALIAVIVGKGSQTAALLKGAGGAFSEVLNAATAPAK